MRQEHNELKQNNGMLLLESIGLRADIQKMKVLIKDKDRYVDKRLLEEKDKEILTLKNKLYKI